MSHATFVAIARLFFVLVVAVSCSVSPEDSYAMSQIIDHFRLITIDDVPPDLRQELRDKKISSQQDLQLKIAGTSDSGIGLDLVVIRIEGEGCQGKFCPTYIRYAFKGGLPAVETLMLQCDEWLMIGDNFPPLKSREDVVGVAAWIVLRIGAGEALVTFTRVGPAITIEKNMTR